MDILVDDDPLNLENLLKCLLEFGDGYARELSPSDFSDEEGAIRVREDFDLDIFVRMRGSKYHDLMGHIRYHDMAEGTRIPYLDANGLIVLKGGSIREKDRIDVAALKRVSQEGMPPGDEVTNLSLDKLRASSSSPAELLENEVEPE
jgi:hypothetical protein